MLQKTIDDVRQIPITAWGFSDPGAPSSGGDGSAFKRILLAATDSKPCTRAVSVAAGLARGSSAEVCVVHLIERIFLGRAGWCSMETADDARRLIGRFQEQLESLGVRVAATIGRARRDQVALSILLAAADYRADVIVVGTRGRSALGAVFFGSVSREVIRMSKVPVLVVR